MVVLNEIGEAEGLYQERRLPAIFKLTLASHPEGLDEVLAARGYAVEARTAVHVAEKLPCVMTSARAPAGGPRR